MTAVGTLDLTIIVAYLAGTLVIGLLVKRYVGRVEHFIVAGRELDVHLGIASLVSSEFGIITVMYAS